MGEWTKIPNMDGYNNNKMRRSVVATKVFKPKWKTIQKTRDKYYKNYDNNL